MATVFRQRRGTAAALAAANEVPASGQIIVETDTRRMKVGDGVTAYNALPYFNTPISSVVGLQAALDGKQAVGSYAASVHTHAVAHVTGLQAALDSKQDAGSYAASVHTHTIAQVDGLQAALDAKQNNGVFSPVTHQHGVITSDGRIGTTAGLIVTTGAGGVLQASSSIPASAISGLAASATVDATDASNIAAGLLPFGRIPVGTTSNTVCVGNDARLTGPRQPTSHASQHATSGDDPITPVSIGAAASSHAHGNITNDGRVQGANSGSIVVIGNNGAITTATTISSSSVAGLAASATTNTTNADNITSGTVAKARLPSDTLYAADLTPVYSAIGGKQPVGEYATLVNGAVPASQLPSYVDDVIEAGTFSALPVPGEAGKVYVTTNNNKVYRWGGSAYIEIVASPGSTDAIAEGTTNLYFTNARAVSAVSNQGLTLAGLTITPSVTRQWLINANGAFFWDRAETTLFNVTTSGAITRGRWESIDPVAVAFGGTGATTAAAARTNLGAAAASHSHATGDVTGLDAALSARAPLNSPTFTGTVSGITAAMVGLGNVANVDARARSSHTGTQLANTISDFAEAAVSAVTWSTITGKPSTFAPSSHASSHGPSGADPLFNQAVNTSSSPLFANLYVGVIAGESNPYGLEEGMLAGVAHTMNSLTGWGRTLNFNTGAFGGTWSSFTHAGRIWTTGLKLSTTVDGADAKSVIIDAPTQNDGNTWNITLAFVEPSAHRTITFPDATGTVALVGHAHAASDITSGTLAIARLPTGTSSTTVCIGNDPRLSDARTPTGAAGGDLTGTYPNPTIANAKVTVGKISATGTPSASTVLAGDGSWRSPTEVDSFHPFLLSGM